MTDVGDKLPFSCLDANWLHVCQFVHISQFPELFFMSFRFIFCGKTRFKVSCSFCKYASGISTS